MAPPPDEEPPGPVGPIAGPHLTLGLLRRLTFRRGRAALLAQRLQSGVPPNARARLRQLFRIVRKAVRETIKLHRTVEFWKAEVRETNRQKALPDFLEPPADGEESSGKQVAFRDLRDLCAELRKYSVVGDEDKGVRNGLENIMAQCHIAWTALNCIRGKYSGHLTDLTVLSDDISRYTLRAHGVLGRFKLEVKSFLRRIDQIHEKQEICRSAKWQVVRHAPNGSGVPTPRDRRPSKAPLLSEKVMAVNNRFQEIIGHVDEIEKTLAKDPETFAREECGIKSVVRRPSKCAGRRTLGLDLRHHQGAEQPLPSSRRVTWAGSGDAGAPTGSVHKNSGTCAITADGSRAAIRSGVHAQIGGATSSSSCGTGDPCISGTKPALERTSSPEDILARLCSPMASTKARRKQMEPSVTQPQWRLGGDPRRATMGEPEWGKTSSSQNMLYRVSSATSVPCSPLASPHKHAAQEKRILKTDSPVSAPEIASASVTGSVDGDKVFTAEGSGLGEDVIEENIDNSEEEERVECTDAIGRRTAARNSGYRLSWMRNEGSRPRRSPEPPQMSPIPSWIKLDEAYVAKPTMPSEDPLCVKLLSKNPVAKAPTQSAPGLKRPSSASRIQAGSRPQSAAGGRARYSICARSVVAPRPSSARSSCRPRGTLAEAVAEKRVPESIYQLISQGAGVRRSTVSLSPRDRARSPGAALPRPQSAAGRNDRFGAAGFGLESVEQRAKHRVACTGARGGA